MRVSTMSGRLRPADAAPQGLDDMGCAKIFASAPSFGFYAAKCYAGAGIRIMEQP